MQYTIGGELYHHQILGGKWGVMHGPPYPLSREVSTGKRLKSSTATAGNANAGAKEKKESLGDKIKKRQQAKKRSAQLEKARAAKAEKARVAAEEKKAQEEREAKAKAAAAAKQEVLEKGTPQEVARYMHSLSDAEYQSVLRRFNNEERLRNYMNETAPKVKTAWERIEDIGDKAGTVANAAGKGVKMWNNVIPIINAVADLDIPIIPTPEKLFEQQAAKLAAERNANLELAKQRQQFMLNQQKQAMQQQNQQGQQQKNQNPQNSQNPQNGLQKQVDAAMNRVNKQDSKNQQNQQAQQQTNAQKPQNQQQNPPKQQEKQQTKSENQNSKYEKAAAQVTKFTQEQLKKNQEKIDRASSQKVSVDNPWVYGIANAMDAQGSSVNEIARSLGIAVSEVQKLIK